MGAFYGNITLRGPSQEKVTQSLRGRRAIVSPKVGDYTVAFDSTCDEQDFEKIRTLTSRLSRELDCFAFAVIVHDDDLLGYFLYDNGELTDWYNSAPSYFNFGSSGEAEGPAGGIAVRLCKAFGAGNPTRLERILRRRPGRGGYAIETDRHSDIVRELSLPRFTVGTTLASFDRGEYPEGLTAAAMMQAADPPPLEDPKRRRDREFYDKLGPEDPSSPCQREGCNRGSVRFSVLCRRHHFEMIEHRDCPFDD